VSQKRVKTKTRIPVAKGKGAGRPKHITRKMLQTAEAKSRKLPGEARWTLEEPTQDQPRISHWYLCKCIGHEGPSALQKPWIPEATMHYHPPRLGVKRSEGHLAQSAWLLFINLCKE
jgi:hypothetical protein